jgi:DNA polymerase IV
MMKNNLRVIFHIDLNQFFASCHLMEDTFLKGKAFVVGGSAVMRRGIVLTASYEARKYGIHSGQSIKEAMDLYPHVLVVPSKFQLYKKYSNLFFELVKKYTHIWTSGSIDEAYMDMSHVEDPIKVAKNFQQELLITHQLPCSIGIAPTLFLAKMASDMKKPMGITILRKRDVKDKLFPLPIEDMYGIGKKTYPTLQEMGIMTIGDFCHPIYKNDILSVMSEESYHHYLNHIYGHSNNLIDQDDHVPKSISQETTLNYAVDDPDLIKELMSDLLRSSVDKLRKHHLYVKTIGYKFKNEAFQSKSKSFTLTSPTALYDVIYDELMALFDQFYNNEPIRLIGVYLKELTSESSAFDLFTYESF